MICSTCNELILPNDTKASGPDGYSHASCAKRSTAHGKELNIFDLYEELGRLKKRVQELEQTVRHHESSIDFRIGGGQ